MTSEAVQDRSNIRVCHECDHWTPGRWMNIGLCRVSGQYDRVLQHPDQVACAHFIQHKEGRKQTDLKQHLTIIKKKKVIT